MKPQNKNKKLGKKKLKRGPIGRVKFYVQATFNNTIITATDMQGNVLAWGSAGNSGFKGAKKSTPFAAQISMTKVLSNLPLNEISQAEVYVKGVGAGRDAAPRALINKGFEITLIKDMTPIPHNGARPKKPRRV